MQEVIASQTSTNCNRLIWRDVVIVKLYIDVLENDLWPVIARHFADNEYVNKFEMHTLEMAYKILVAAWTRSTLE
jgi:hypothetical protein